MKIYYINPKNKKTCVELFNSNTIKCRIISPQLVSGMLTIVVFGGTSALNTMLNNLSEAVANYPGLQASFDSFVRSYQEVGFNPLLTLVAPIEQNRVAQEFAMALYNTAVSQGEFLAKLSDVFQKSVECFPGF